MKDVITFKTTDAFDKWLECPFCLQLQSNVNINTLRLRRDGRLFPDDIFKCIFFNEKVSILIQISLTFVLKAPINNISALVQIMAWRRPGNKPLSKPMMVSLVRHICVTRPQWVKTSNVYIYDLSYHTLDDCLWLFSPLMCYVLKTGWSCPNLPGLF